MGWFCLVVDAIDVDLTANTKVDQNLWGVHHNGLPLIKEAYCVKCQNKYKSIVFGNPEFE